MPPIRQNDRVPTRRCCPWQSSPQAHGPGRRSPPGSPYPAPPQPQTIANLVSSGHLDGVGQARHQLCDVTPGHSEEKKSPAQKRNPRQKDHEAHCRPNNKLSFLTLPTEIRLQICDCILAGHEISIEGEYAGVTVQPPLLELAILRTCKQIYNEANPIFWTRNRFAFTEPSWAPRIISRCGPTNFGLVRELQFSVWPVETPEQWLFFVGLVAKKAAGLRSLAVQFETAESQDECPENRGLGDNISFVHALGKIKGLDELLIGGCYAYSFLSYLELHTSAQVKAAMGHEATDGANGLWKDKGEWLTELLEGGRYHESIAYEYAQEWADFQKGIENLRP